MTYLRNLAAWPVILLAIGLWALADWFAWLSKGVGESAARIAGQR